MPVRRVETELVGVQVGRPQLPGHEQEYITLAFVNEESGQYYLIRLALGCPTCAGKRGEIPEANFTLMAGSLEEVAEAHFTTVLQSNAVTLEITGKEEIMTVYGPHRDRAPAVG